MSIGWLFLDTVYCFVCVGWRGGEVVTVLDGGEARPPPHHLNIQPSHNKHIAAGRPLRN